MYLKHYGLNRKPFDISPDPSFLWLGEKHQEGLAILKYGILENKGFLLITGDVGTGKTALIRAIEQEVQASAIIVTIPDPGLDLIDFYNFLASELDMGRTFTHKAEFLIHFKRLLVSTFSTHKRVLLIVDESQRLNHNLLEEIRLLSNIDLEGKVLINIFFVGQSEFRQLLAKDENRSVRQRITVSYHIQPLTENETRQYIQHRLKVAGAKGPIFSMDAMQAVFENTRGYPRLINIVCDHALMTGYARGSTAVGREIIEECAGELRVTIGLEAPAGAARPAPAAPSPLPAHLPAPQTGSGAKPLRSLLALAGCMALLAAVWMVWGDGISDTLANWGKRPQSRQEAGAADGSQPAVQSPAPPLAAQPEQRAQGPAEPRVLPTPSSPAEPQPQPAAATQPEPRVDAPPPQAVEAAKAAPAPSPPPAAEPPRTAVQAAAATASAAPSPAEPGQREFVIYFTISSTEIPIYAQETLTGIARRVADSPRMTAVIEGHTDAIGDPEFNQAISESRAAAVKNYLVDKGVPPARLSTVGMGSEKPQEANDTPQGRSRNRRVVVRLVEGR
ncbi:MAG: OmpA family protein [Desulfobacterales bacterium]